MRNPQRRGVHAVSHFVHGHERSLSPAYFRGRQHVAAIVVLAILAVVAFRAFPTQDVLVMDDGRTVQVRAALNPREEALEAVSVQVRPTDRVTFASGSGQSSLAIKRAKTVNIEVDDDLITVATHATTVSGALAAAGVELADGDRVYVNGTAATQRAPIDTSKQESTELAAQSLAELAPVDLTEPHEPIIRVVRAVPFTVVIDDRRLETSSASSTVRGALEDMGIIVREGDLVSPGLQSPVVDGMTVRLAKARSIQLTLDGAERTMYTLAEDVAGILAVLEIEPGPDDTVTPGLDSPVTEGMDLNISRTRIVEEDVEELIQPGTVYETDRSMPSGQTRVVEGTPGVRVVTHRVTYRDGEEIDREVVPDSARVAREPVPARFITGNQRQPGEPPRPTTVDAPAFDGEYRTKMTVWTTWYNATHGGKHIDDPWYGYTATGVKLRKGICATDPNVIPLGTWMHIPGYGTCLAADTGGGVKGHHVDLGHPGSETSTWGAKTIEIFILD